MIKNLLIIIGFTTIVLNTFADCPNAAKITSVSVDAYDSIEIKWNASPLMPIDRYDILKITGYIAGTPKYDTITSVSKAILTYKIQDLSVTPIKVQEFIIDTYSNATPFSSCPPHNTMVMSGSYDACSESITLTWNGYKGWDNGVKEYKIRNAYTDVVLATTQQTSATIPNIEPDKTYRFYVTAISNGDNYEAQSYRYTIKTPVEYVPKYINAAATVDAENQISVLFNIDPSTEFRKFNLVRKLVSTGSITTIQEYNNISTFQITYTDNDVLTDDRQYKYYLHSYNKCGKPSIKSEETNNIVLRVNNNERINKVSWTFYEPEKPSGNIYKLYRENNGVAKMIKQFYSDSLTNITGGGFLFEDNLADIQYKDYQGEMCYYIEVVDKDIPSFKVMSNVVCKSVKPLIFIPNAINPGGANSIFLPKIDFSPKEYYMCVYNRWGTKIFETKTSTEGWNGTYNGAVLPPGTYVYSISVTPFEGDAIYRRGDVSIVY